MPCGQFSQTPWDADISAAAAEFQVALEDGLGISASPEWKPDPDRVGWWSAEVERA